jgi:hypothetical protein
MPLIKYIPKEFYKTIENPEPTGETSGCKSSGDKVDILARC